MNSMTIESLLDDILPISAFDMACSRRLAAKETQRANARVKIMSFVEQEVAEAFAATENLRILPGEDDLPLTAF